MRKAILLVAIVAVAVGAYLWHARGGMDTRTAPGSVETVIARAVRVWSVPGRYKSMPNPMACTEAELTEAREHWADHCATCHANNGSGETMLGKTMYPPPPEMRREPTQSQSDGELYYVIKNGVRLTGMPAFGEPGDRDANSWHLVCFIRHLPRMTDDEELAMRDMNPKTAKDLEEERQEREFLNGGPAPSDAHANH